ncbi:hypothetical protein DMA11_11790 [Marinilabiliaceae bacterium JC017]|nr:hypothetical protein DMA11_11790 [Marinilabiliaceae bacterium JC017]
MNDLNKTKLKQAFGSIVTTVEETSEYDHFGRLKKTWHNYNNKGNLLIADNSYNELGELINKKVGNNEQMDYEYNIRGWLTQINNPDVVEANKQFAMRLHYNDNTTSLTGSN